MRPCVEEHPSIDGTAILWVACEGSAYLDEPFLDGLQEAVADLRGMAHLRSVILAGRGNHFSAGASRESLTGTTSGHELSSYVRQVPRLILEIPVLTIAAMEGHAVGGGLMLGLWCDLAFLAEESLYGTNFMALGFTPGMGSTRLLEEWVGRSLARQMLYTGRLLKGREIREAAAPASHTVVPRRDVLARALEIAADVSEHPVDSIRLLKASHARRDAQLLDEACEAEREMHGRLFGREATRQTIAERYGGVPLDASIRGQSHE